MGEILGSITPKDRKLMAAATLSAVAALGGAPAAASETDQSHEAAAQPSPIVESVKSEASFKPDTQELPNGEIVVFESPTPTEAIVEELKAEDVSINAILDGDYDPITRDEYEEIISSATPAITEYDFGDLFSPEEIVDLSAELTRDGMSEFDRLVDNSGDIKTRSLQAFSVVNDVRYAQVAFEDGETEAARAYMNFADAKIRAGATFLEIDGKGPEVVANRFENNIQNQAQKYEVK